MENVEQYLHSETGYDWQEISQLYLSFRIATNPFGQICVFTPDNIGRTLLPRLYIPKDCYQLHNPAIFLNDYLNAKKNLVKAMPIIQFHLDSAPRLSFIKQYGESLFAGELKLTGHLSFTTLDSLNNMAISKNSLMTPVNTAKNDLADLIPASSVGVDYDTNGFSLFLESSIQTSLGKTTIKIHGGTFSAEYSPQPISLDYKGWHIEGELGFEASGTYTKHQSPPGNPNAQPASSSFGSPSDNNEKWLIGGGVLAGGGVITACVIFSAGWCTIPIATAGLGGLVYKLAN